MNSIIESFGIYLPPTELTTADILAKCRSKITFPLERVTGIRSRRVAGETEFSIDLAKKAVARCLRNSHYGPGDIDLLICCNISRYDGPDMAFTFEPSTAVRLRQHFGFDHAVAFDVMNACAGMFTGIAIVDAALKAGQARRAMVVSGEYISHLIQTAQKEIKGFMDSRMACLTVGDAGAAVILEPAAAPDLGFLDSEIFTLGAYSSYCVAKITDQEHGGAIMLTDAIKLASVSIKQGVKHAAEVQERNGWPPDGFDHLIMHQTSELTLNDTAREINSHFDQEVCRGDNTICNLERRGNTASTSHFVALADHILNGRIRSGQKLVFGISGSGLTIGTAIYALDDLPDRMRRAELEERIPEKKNSLNGSAPVKPAVRRPRIRIESVGTLDGSMAGLNSLTATRDAARAGLDRSTHDKNDVGLLIHAGVYRSEYISEPALATMLAGELGINSKADEGGNRTLALDVFNGATGCLNACYVAAQMMWAKKCRVALISVSEIENNVLAGRPERRGLKETASSLVLDCVDGEKGFGNFLFRSFGDATGSFRSYTQFEKGKTYLRFEAGEEDEAQQMSLIKEMVGDLLAQEGVGLDAVKVIMPPQDTPAWIARLAAAMGLPLERFVDATHPEGDLFTSSLPFAFRRVQEERRASAGDLGLVIAVGSGGQVGCATYHF